MDASPGKAKVEHSLEGAALRLEGGHRGQEDLLHTAAGHLGRVVGRGGDGAHAAGVGALVAVKGPLVILGGSFLAACSASICSRLLL